MAADLVDEAAGRLYGLPFEDFIPERDARAKELRKAGERDAAGEVAKLPKPSQVAWAANQLARGGVDDLLAAGEALRETQLGGGGRDAMRSAAAAERKAVEALVRTAPKPGGRALSRASLDRLRTLLHAVARDDGVREAFVAGRLVEEPEGGAWPVGEVSVPASKPASRKGTKSGRRDRDEARQREAAERREREAARKREEADRRRLERRLQTAQARADDARERLESAREAYESATHEVARIEEQL